MKAFWIVLVLVVAGVVGMPGANAWPGTLNGRPSVAQHPSRNPQRICVEPLDILNWLRHQFPASREAGLQGKTPPAHPSAGLCRTADIAARFAPAAKSPASILRQSAFPFHFRNLLDSPARASESRSVI
jgi:hypothetical protein